jgi:hypothetical protein
MQASSHPLKVWMDRYRISAPVLAKLSRTGSSTIKKWYGKAPVLKGWDAREAVIVALAKVAASVEPCGGIAEPIQHFANILRRELLDADREHLRPGDADRTGAPSNAPGEPGDDAAPGGARAKAQPDTSADGPEPPGGEPALPDATVVRVLDERSRRVLGLGTVVMPGRVLTARSILEGATSALVEIPGRADPLPACVAWPGDAEVDVALLDVTVPSEQATHCLALFGGVPLAVGARWEVEVPHGARRVAIRGEVELHGKTLVLVPEREAPANTLAILPGGAVLHASHVVGVVRGRGPSDAVGPIGFTPVSAFLDDPAFRRAAGLEMHDVDLGSELEALVAELTQRLSQLPELALAVAAGLSVPRENLPRALVETPVARLTQVFAEVDGTRVHDDVGLLALLALLALLWRVLAYAVDLRRLVVAARAAIAQGAPWFELPLRTETLAEMVLAGAAGRPCDFGRGNFPPEGFAYVKLPSPKDGAFFKSNKRTIAEAILLNVGREKSGVWREALDRFPRFSDYSGVAESLFRKSLDPKSPTLPYYFLFIDEDLPEMEHADASLAWTVVRSALTEHVPSLRLVRLRGGAERFREETDVIVDLDSILRKGTR